MNGFLKADSDALSIGYSPEQDLPSSHAARRERLRRSPTSSTVLYCLFQ